MKLRSFLSALMCLALLLGLAPAALAAEKDYRCSPWAAEEMAEALRLGFLPADLPEDCTGPITRRDYARVALNFVSELQFNFHVGGAFFAEAYCQAKSLKSAAPFADAPEEALTQARSIGLVQGRSETEYDPDSGITRQEAALILRRAYSRYADPEALEAAPAAYADGEKIAAWAREGVDFVTAAGVMQGVGEGKIDPLGAYTVEQCVVTFLRLYKSAPVSRAKGNVEPLLPSYQVTALLVTQKMGDMPITLERKTEAAGCAVLHCAYRGLPHGSLDYLYVVFDGGGVWDALSALSTVGDAERYAALGNLRRWSWSFTEDGGALTLHGEYASGDTEDYLFRLDPAAMDPWTPYTPEPGGEAVELVKSCGVIVPRRLADTGVKIVGLLPPDPSGEDMIALGEDGSVFIWENVHDDGPEGKAIWRFEWAKTPVRYAFFRFTYCCVDDRGVLWSGERGGGLAPRMTGVRYGETYLSEGLAVTTAGQLLLWYGEEAPVCVLENVGDARRFGSFVYAIGNDGALWRLAGFGEQDKRILTDPRPEKLLDGVRAVSGCLALKEDGSVWSLAGEAPEKMLDDGVYIHSNGSAFAAVLENGELWCWGTLHQPGNVQKTVTLDAPTLCCEDVKEATCCYDGILILKTDGTLLTLRYEDGELQSFPVA